MSGRQSEILDACESGRELQTPSRPINRAAAEHAATVLIGNITVGTRRQYAEQSLKWDAGIAAEKSDDEMLQRIWNLAEDSIALIAALDALTALAERAEELEGEIEAAKQFSYASHRQRAEAAEAEVRSLHSEKAQLGGGSCVCRFCQVPS